MINREHVGRGFRGVLVPKRPKILLRRHVGTLGTLGSSVPLEAPEYCRLVNWMLNSPKGKLIGDGCLLIFFSRPPPLHLTRQATAPLWQVDATVEHPDMNRAGLLGGFAAQIEAFSLVARSPPL